MTPEETTSAERDLDPSKSKKKPSKKKSKKPEVSTTPEEKDEQEEVELDPVEILEEKLKKKDEALADSRKEYLRLKADTENYRKRLEKEKAENTQYANKRLLKELIVIQDNLHRALSANSTTIENLKEGVEMISKQFQSFLEKENVKPIQALGQKFDPSLHEVCRQAESGEHEESTIIEEYSRGYLLNGKVLQPSQVVISKLPAKGSEKSSEKGKDEEKNPEEPADE